MKTKIKIEPFFGVGVALEKNEVETIIYIGLPFLLIEFSYVKNRPKKIKL